MKKLLSISILLFFSVSSFAQDSAFVKETSGYDGRVLPYISDQAFRNIKIDNTLRLAEVMDSNSIDHVTAQLGNPIDVENQKDKAADGTVLFETQILSYSGLKFYYPKNKTFQISNIDFTSDEHFFRINGKKTQVGMNLDEISGKLISALDFSPKRTEAILYVLETDPKGNLQKNKKGNISGGFRYIKFEIEPSTNRITRISIIFTVI